MSPARLVELTAGDGHRFGAWRCDPAVRPKGVIVVLHAVFGLTERMGAVCARWAEAGYLAVAPALFARVSAKLLYPYDRAEDGIRAYSALRPEQILADIEASSRVVPGLEAVALCGFCTGGSWAWRAAAARPFHAQVNFYGSHIPALIDLIPRCPTILHYGDTDRIVPAAEIEKIRQRHPSVELYVYPGVGHAFENPDQGGYNRNAAELAWTRSIQFLDRTLNERRTSGSGKLSPEGAT